MVGSPIYIHILSKNYAILKNYKIHFVNLFAPCHVLGWWQNWPTFEQYYLESCNSKWYINGNFTAQKMKFSIMDFFSKCDQIRRKLRIWSHLLKKSVIENFVFCTVSAKTKRFSENLWKIQQKLNRLIY